jgi:ATP/maltotriose-dependent transcriptional regulator MalT
VASVRESTVRDGGRAVRPHVLRAKLRVPPQPPHYVRRSRLLSFLDELAQSPLTVVSAPAGAGKTSLLAGWIAERDAPSAWLSLDDADRDPVPFWIDVIAAIEMLRPGCGGRALRRLRDRKPVLDAVGQLIDALDGDLGDGRAAADRSDCVLVIDDLQYVEDSPVARDALGLFVRHLPDWLHLVLASRHAPDLQLDRLRAHGRLGEIRFSELRFSHDEATELLSRLAPALGPDQVRSVTAQVDGLAAGLQVIALKVRSLSHQERSELSVEAESMMHDFVFHDALHAEDADLVDVLMSVAVVERLNRSLAATLTGRSDADELLSLAEQRGLFVTAVDPAGWFELHALARSALVAELARRSPERLLEQHLRAARWFEEAENIPLALTHLLLADRPLDALRLLAARQAELYDTAREGVIARTIEQIPIAIAASDLEAMLDYARCYMFIDRNRFLDAVEQVTWHAEQAGSLSPTTRARLAVVRAQAAFIAGDFEAGGGLARESIELFGGDWWRDSCGRLSWNLVARHVAFTERWIENDREVREARLSLTRTPDRRLAYEGTRALGEALAGRPLDALRIAAGARRAADIAAMTALRAELMTAEAIAARELGDRERARTDLETIVEAPVGTMPFCNVLARCELAYLHLDEGRLDRAAEVHERAEHLVASGSFGPSVFDLVARVGVQRALWTGRVDEAHRHAATISDPYWHAVCRARTYLAEGGREDALDALDLARPRCVRHEVVRELVRARAVDDRDEAAKLVAGAVKLAAPCGMLQTIASEGPELLELVEHAAGDAPAPWLDRLRRAAIVPTPSIGRSTDLVEPLTERELDVLRFLPSRLTIREIAAELYVSVNTLKFHLRMIYRKLGVRSRAEAAAYARHMTGAHRQSSR